MSMLTLEDYAFIAAIVIIVSVGVTAVGIWLDDVLGRGD